MVKVQARTAAIQLRKAGHSYNYIAASVGVSKGTLSAWLADVPYAPNAQTLQRIGKARAAANAAIHTKMLASLARARDEAQKDIGRISKRDLFMLGLGLYIGEGTKSIYSPCVVNANPAIINAMIRWFNGVVGVPRENFRIALHIYPDSNHQKCLAYWATVTGLERSQFLKVQIDRRKGKKVAKSGKLPYGTVQLRVLSLGEKKFGVFLARKILAWSDIVLKHKTKAGVV